MNTEKPLIILTAGGTGGHVYPAESLAEELSARGYRLALVTDSRGKNNYKGTLGEIKNFAVCAGAIVGKSKWFKLKSLVKTFIGIIQSCFILAINRPVCVVGFGVYASFPCSAAAILLRKKLFIHEQNSVMSRTNRLLSKHATLIAKSFERTKNIPQNVKTKLVGMPVRKAIIDIKDHPRPGLEHPQLLILGGSQGAKIFGEVVPAAIKKLPLALQKKLTIYQQCRKEDVNAVTTAYKGIPAQVTVSAFFNNMPELYQKINLIISRTGASTVSEILCVGIPSILVPLPTAADDHQTGNALEIKEHHAGIVMTQKEFNADSLSQALEHLLASPEELNSMSASAKKLGINNAAKRFADTIMEELK